MPRNPLRSDSSGGASPDADCAATYRLSAGPRRMPTDMAAVAAAGRTPTYARSGGGCHDKPGEGGAPGWPPGGGSQINQNANTIAAAYRTVERHVMRL